MRWDCGAGHVTLGDPLSDLERRGRGRGRPKTIQLGNREWVTLIAAISASSWSVNIQSAFRDAGPIPLQPDAVLSKLDVQLRTPTPAALLEAL
ncbi:hypothetical protein PTT_14158 [Pyrenophora teres f. teres 0-1]|uniref:Uncharacterized protein n=1 Tax=Pyrenophora teres f. teres (strain 0-1) TaxID=861557 RepID=E3RXM5_PYRTT|nr:hypothetical protein PTT_14158 [Pyrenophora teres f. teres 0-1]